MIDSISKAYGNIVAGMVLHSREKYSTVFQTSSGITLPILANRHVKSNLMQAQNTLCHAGQGPMRPIACRIRDLTLLMPGLLWA